MAARLKIGISWSPDALTVAVGEVRRSVQALRELLRLPLPLGSIDAVTGRVACEKTLRAVLEQAYLSARLDVKGATISMAIPSSAVYVRTWTEAGRPKLLSQVELSQRVERIFPGKSAGLVFDGHQHWVPSKSYTQCMLVVVNREVVESYVRLLGSRGAVVACVTTSEIARYVACCRINSSIVHKPCVVVSANDEYLQATTWKEGVICDSRPTLVSRKTDCPAQQRSSHTDALTSSLAAALACCSEFERAACKVVVCYGAASGAVEQSLCALGYSGMHVEHMTVFLRAQSDNDQPWHLLRAFKGEITQGAEDALGLLMLGER